MDEQNFGGEGTTQLLILTVWYLYYSYSFKIIIKFNLTRNDNIDDLNNICPAPKCYVGRKINEKLLKVYNNNSTNVVLIKIKL